MASVPGVTEDSWLSGILGRPAYRVSVKELLADGANDGFIERLTSGPLFAYSKVATDDVASVHFLQSVGFRLVDTGVILEKPIGTPGPVPQGVRLARAGDRAAVKNVARESFEFSRFHLDPCIPQDLANRVKEAWADSYFAVTRGDAMVVKDVDGTVPAFLAMLLDESQRTATIDLIAVSPQHRGHRHATDMIRFAEAQYAGCARLRVGTQIANMPSLHMYHALGFRLAESSYVFHYHHSAS